MNEKTTGLLAELAVPFADKEISHNDKIVPGKTISFVSPDKYRSRLRAAAGDYGYTIRMFDVERTATGIQASLQLLINEEGAVYDITVVGFEDYTYSNDKVINVGFTYQALKSILLKSALAELGLGAHLSEREATGNNGQASRPAQAAPAQAATPAGPWTGDALITFGKKHPGKRWNDPSVDMEWLKFITSGEKPNADALKEIARREELGAPVGASGNTPF